MAEDPNSDEKALIKAAEAEKQKVFVDQDRARGGINLAQSTGRQNRGMAAVHDQGAISGSDQDKEKHDKAMRTAMSQMQKDVEQRLQELSEVLEEANQGLDAIAKIRQLRKEGKFDPTNIEHLLLLETAGLSVDDITGPDADKKLDEKEKEWEDIKEKAENDIKGLNEQLENSNSPEQTQETMIASNRDVLSNIHKFHDDPNSAAQDFSLEEVDKALQAQAEAGREESGVVRENNAESALAFLSISEEDIRKASVTGSLDGDGTYTQPLKEGLTIQPEFTVAALGKDTSPSPDPGLQHDASPTIFTLDA